MRIDIFLFLPRRQVIFRKIRNGDVARMSAATCGWLAPDIACAHPGYACWSFGPSRNDGKWINSLSRGHRANDATASISISIFGSGSAWTTQVVRAG